MIKQAFKAGFLEAVKSGMEKAAALPKSIVDDMTMSVESIARSGDPEQYAKRFKPSQSGAEGTVDFFESDLTPMPFVRKKWDSATAGSATNPKRIQLFGQSDLFPTVFRHEPGETYMEYFPSTLPETEQFARAGSRSQDQQLNNILNQLKQEHPDITGIAPKQQPIFRDKYILDDVRPENIFRRSKTDEWVIGDPMIRKKQPI